MDDSTSKETVAFDLDDILDENDTAWTTVTNPLNGEPVLGSDGKPWRIQWAGPHHKITKDLEVKNRLGGFKAHRTRGEEGLIARVAQADVFDLENLVTRCLGWSPILRKAADFPCTEENKKAVFTTAHMQDQANKFLNDRAAFLAKSAKD